MILLIGAVAAAVAIWPDGSAVTRSRALAGPIAEERGRSSVGPGRRSQAGAIGHVGATRQMGHAAAAIGRIVHAATGHNATTTTRVAAMLAAVPGLVLLWAAGIPGLVAGLLLGRTAAKLVGAVGMRRKGRREAESAAIALETLTAQLRAGAAAARALAAAAGELRRSAGGSELAEALAHAARRAQFADPWEDDEPREQLRHIGRLWRVAERHGLSLAGLLECAREDLRARQTHRSQTSAALAGPRMTIAILASLPVFGLVMGQAFGAAPLEFLSRGIGGIVLVIGVGLVCAGIEWAVAIIDRAEAGE